MAELYTSTDGGVEPAPLPAPAELSPAALAFEAQQAGADALGCAAGLADGTHTTAMALAGDGDPLVTRCPTCLFLAWLPAS